MEDGSLLEHRTVDESVLERRLNGVEDPKDLPLPLLQHITNDFSEDRKIGQGGFGAVYKGVLQSGKPVAVKRIYVNEYTIDGKAFRREFNSLVKTNHENVVRFLGFCSNTHQTSIKVDATGKNDLVNINERLLCLEYISNGSLDTHITDELRGLPWETRYEIIFGICKGLRYLHEEKRIVHMDLKPANILLDGKNMVPKISDFDLSRPDENSHTTGQCVGTQGYIAPEYRDTSKTSMKCDIYSLGVIIIELVTGCKGLPDEHKVLRRWRHRWSKPPAILQLQQVTRCIKIGVRCREKKPEHRPPISEIISFLGEPASTDDHTSQICPDYNENDMLGIKPLELRLPSEGKKEISCSVELTNDTANCIAFNIQPSRPRLYGAQPNKGIVRPQSKYDVKIIVPPQHVEHVEKFIIKSRKVSEGLEDETIKECMFEEAGIVVDEVDLKIKYNPIFGKSKLLPERAIFSRHYHTNMKYLQEESDRAVDVTRGAMGSVLDKLGKLITEENNLEHNMKSDIESFSQELMKLHLDLPKLEKHDGVKFWVNEVKELSYKIEDMVDNLLVPVEHESTSSELPDEGLDPWQYAINNIGRVIKDIKNKVQCVTDNRNMYNFDVNNVLANVKAKATTDLQIWAKKDKEELIGIEKPRDELIRLFEEDGNVPNNKLKIFSIVGMGGLGKTALVKAVYDKLEAQYHPKAFVKVGQNADVKVVLKNILTGCGKDATNMEHLDVEQLTSQLQQLLMYERYFIVIDDLWDSETMNNETWDTIKFALPGNNCGSRVITTTRIDHVARACCYDEMKYIRMMNPLSDNDSRTLFLSRIFGPKEPCPDALKDISIHILKRCGGLPLAINSIANLLIGDQRRSTWDDVRQNWSAMMKGNALERMNQILDLSYVHLPYQLKTCLLYVGMYQNSNKDLHHMLRKWVAEGFVEKSTNDGVDEDVAELYLRALRGMCMLQVDKVGYCNGEVLHYRVHPIMLDLIRVKAAKENFIHVIDGSKSMGGDIHRVSIHHNDKVDKQIWGAIEVGSLSHVRSVFLRRSSLVPYFLELKYVRVLHIEYKYSSMDGLDLTGINRLSLLRYLKVSSVDESIYELKLPSKIGDLQELETIELHNACLKNYPSDIVSLPWLRHLISTGNKVGVVLPDEIDRLETLRTLVGVCLNGRSVHNIKGISKLTNLRELKIILDGTIESSTVQMNALQSSIPMLSNLMILEIRREHVIKLDVQGLVSRALFPQVSLIWELNLLCCEFKMCPKWIGQLHHIYKLTITVREVAESISIVARMPSLAYLNLLTDLLDSKQKEESVVIPGGGAFKNLKYLDFNCKNVLVIFEVGAMPKLEELSIALRYRMAHRFLPVGIEHLPTGTLKAIVLKVLPNDPRLVQESPQVMEQRKKSVRYLLKEAFKPHHPTAGIVLYFCYDSAVPIDDEDIKGGAMLPRSNSKDFTIEASGGRSSPFVEMRKRKASGGIHIRDPIDPTPLRQVPPQSSTKATEPPPPSKRRKGGFNPPRASDKETSILQNDGRSTEQGESTTAGEPTHTAEEQRPSIHPQTDAEASSAIKDLSPSHPHHPVVGQNTPDHYAREPSIAEEASTLLQRSEAVYHGHGPSSAPADRGEGSSRRPATESDVNKLLGYVPAWVPEGEEHQRPPHFGFAKGYPIDETKAICSVDDTEEETEWVESTPVVDTLLKRLPRMIKDLQEFHHDATQILRPNMETWGKRSCVCVKSQYIKDTVDVGASHVDPAKRIRELACNKDETEERAQAAEPEIACLNGDHERAMKVAEELGGLYLTQAEYEERVKLAAEQCREVESLRAIVAESGVFRSANEELRARVFQLEEDARNNTLVLTAALDAQEKMEGKLRTTEVLLTEAREAADSNNKMANKYEHGWSRVSRASTLVADAILGDTRISGEKELDRLNKAHVEAEALMATARATCTALFPDTDIGRSAASLANVMIDGPSEFHKWKVSASREGARMALASVVSHYPTLKLGKVQEGVDPDEPDVQALGRKVELAAWKLASYCPLEDHMDDLPAQEQE